MFGMRRRLDVFNLAPRRVLLLFFDALLLEPAFMSFTSLLGGVNVHLASGAILEKLMGPIKQVDGATVLCVHASIASALDSHTLPNLIAEH